MSRAGLGYDLEKLRAALVGVGGDASTGVPRFSSLHVLGECGSTNDEARSLVAAGEARGGTVVVANSQSGGRGRQGRAWHSPPGLGLYASVVLELPAAPERLTRLPILVGLAIAEAVHELDAPAVALKWPNDVLVGGRKIAGVLCECEAETSSPEGPRKNKYPEVGQHCSDRRARLARRADAGMVPLSRVSAAPPGRMDRRPKLRSCPCAGPKGSTVVAGFGVNVHHLLVDFPPELRDVATSFRLVSDEIVSREWVLRTILARLHGLLRASPALNVFPWARWRSFFTGEGRRVRVRAAGGPPVEGCILRVDPDGALVLSEDAGGEQRIVAGDVDSCE